MLSKIVIVAILAVVAMVDGLQPNNYDISRNPNLSNNLGFGLKEIADFFLGGGYGSYPQYPNYPHRPGGYPQHPGQGLYPSGPGHYPSGSQYPGSGYPHHPGLVGPPGAHPGCPLCDSSVYSYCSHKQAHDSCCCENSLFSFGCRKSDCNFLYANSCDEYNLITECCCVDVAKNAVVPAGPVVPGALG